VLAVGFIPNLKTVKMEFLKALFFLAGTVSIIAIILATLVKYDDVKDCYKDGSYPMIILWSIVLIVISIYFIH
jgi:hypothetical protein